jgi:protein O-GlcNAc transferase
LQSQQRLDEAVASCQRALELAPNRAAAHTTASDALWAGCPLLALAGETLVSRVAGSLLRALGLEELVTHRPDDYEATALRLATDPAELAGLRARLAASRLISGVFDAAPLARNLEAAYTTMWERFQAGQPPAAFRVART